MAASILYRDHLIVATAQFNRAANSWTGRADISSEYYNGKEESHQLIGPKNLHQLIGPKNLHLTERAAEYFMIAAARNWIEASLGGAARDA
jgi:hypothetical protein